MVRGQFQGYRTEPGVAPDSKVETFAALKLQIDSWRWRGVPFYIRAGKCLAVTCTEILVRLRQPPTMYKHYNLKPNYVRLRISPDVVLAFGLNVTSPDEESTERLIGIDGRQPSVRQGDGCLRTRARDAMAGTPPCSPAKITSRKRGALLIPCSKAATPVHEYEPNTWGPQETQRVTPPGGWQNPVVTPDKPEGEVLTKS